MASAATSALAAGWYRSSSSAQVLSREHHARMHWKVRKPPVLRPARAGMLAGQIPVA
jgi:hypothetical protein